MKKNGGLRGIEQQAEHKAGLLYPTIDASQGYYQCPVLPEYRSLMNVVFRLPNKRLENLFLEQALASDLVNLKGHRSVGGCRASIYNAMPVASVEALGEFMQFFARRNTF